MAHYNYELASDDDFTAALVQTVAAATNTDPINLPSNYHTVTQLEEFVERYADHDIGTHDTPDRPQVKAETEIWNTTVMITVVDENLVRIEAEELDP